MSTIGTLIGSLSISLSRVWRTSPWYDSVTSKLVPPMSTEIEFCCPACSAMATLPITPAAGPDSMVCTGRSTAEAALIVPPFDCMMYRSELIPASTIPRLRFVTYVPMTGETYELITVVLIRSNSLNSGSISWDSETTTPGSASRSALPTVISCSGLAYE